LDRFLDPILIVSLIVLTIALAVIVLVPVDISPWRDLAGDSLFRDDQPAPAPQRFRDPSPHRVWLPSDLFVWDSIRSGELPLWERMQGGGYSPVITLYNGVFHPLRWATALVPRSAAPSVFIALALWCAFVGMYLLMRRGLGSGVPAALFGAIAFAFGPATMSMALFSGAVLPMAHLPWAVWLMRRASERRTFSSAIPLIAGLGLTILSGHPLLIFAAFLALGFLAAGMSLSERSLAVFAIFFASAAAAACLVAFAWLPTILAWDGLWTYKASEIGYGFGYYTFAGWLNLLRSLFIDRLGDGVMLDEAPSFGYAGLAASLLIGAGVAAARRDVAARLFALLLLIFFLLAFPGPWMAPLIGIPPIAYLKPWYYSGVFGLFLAAVAAIGLDILWRARGRIRVAGIALAIIAAAIYLARAGRVLAPRTESVSLASAAHRFLKADRDNYRVTGLWGETHLPNISRISGIEDVRYSGPMMTLRYHLWWLLIDPQVLRHTYPTARISDRIDHPLMRGFGVRYVLESRLAFRDSFYTVPDPRLRDTMLSRRLSGFPIEVRTPSIEVRRMPGHHSRAHFAPVVLRVHSPVAAAETLRNGGDGLAAVVESENEVPSGGTGQVTVSYPAATRVWMEVTSATGGLVVLHDSFADGWTATIDGDDAKVLAVNLLSRGVVVPAGTHRVEMRYWPPGFRAGAGVSAVTLLMMVLSGWRQAGTGARSG
jgi:hypothetical protein